MVFYPYISKVGLAGWKNPQMIWNFLQRDCLGTRMINEFLPQFFLPRFARFFRRFFGLKGKIRRPFHF